MISIKDTTTRRARGIGFVAVGLVLLLPAPAGAAQARFALVARVAQQPKKDYLSPLEADQIRDAMLVSDRV